MPDFLQKFTVYKTFFIFKNNELEDLVKVLFNYPENEEEVTQSAQVCTNWNKLDNNVKDEFVVEFNKLYLY